MLLSPIILIGAFAIALSVGVLTGIFGIGGGFLMTPALMIFLGIPGPLAIGTDLATIMTNSSFAVFKRRGTQTIDVKLAITIGLGTSIGVLLGSHVLEALKGIPNLVLFGREHDGVEYVLLCLFLVLLVLIAVYILIENKHRRRQGDLDHVGYLSRVRLRPSASFDSVGNRELSMPVLVALGVLIGSLTGLMGIGGGVVLVPALIYLVGQKAKSAVGTSLLIVLGASLIGVVHKGIAGYVSFPLWLSMAIGGIIGTYMGGRIGFKLSGSKIQRYFVYVIYMAIGLIVWKIVKITAL